MGHGQPWAARPPRLPTSAEVWWVLGIQRFQVPGRPCLRARHPTACAPPAMARPTRHVSPTTLPARLRMQEMRCRVLSMPARLSPPNSPTCGRWGRGGGMARHDRAHAGVLLKHEPRGHQSLLGLQNAGGAGAAARSTAGSTHLVNRILQVLHADHIVRQPQVARGEAGQRRPAAPTAQGGSASTSGTGGSTCMAMRQTGRPGRGAGTEGHAFCATATRPLPNRPCAGTPWRTWPQPAKQTGLTCPDPSPPLAAAAALDAAAAAPARLAAAG